jgi:2-desacetyl-2-hydroxyethyl bacteriochlorophyllide A dehydrogenase
MPSRVIVFPEPGRIEVDLEEVAEPGPGELACAAEASLVSTGTELACLRGVADPGTNWAEWLRFPFRPGYSMAARVVALGDGVDGFREGDRVATWTAHRERFTVPARLARRIPDGVGAEEASFMVLGSTTQLAARRAALALGERVAVIGLGLLGQLVVQYARIAGARTIVAIDTVAARRGLALAHGATHALDVDAAAAREAVAELTGGRMLDAVFDVTGHPAVLAAAVGLVRQLGRVVLLGDTPTPTRQPLGPGVVSNSVAILGIHALARPEEASDFAPWSAGAIAEVFFEFLVQGRLRVADLVSHRHAPEDAPRVYADLARDRSGAMGVVFDWSRGG